MSQALLPFDLDTVRPLCEELDAWHRRLSWKDWHGRAWTGRLRRDVEAEAVAASTRMEGIPVTVEEVRRILAGDRPAAVSPIDVRLVEGYRDALRYAQSRADDAKFRWNGELIIGLHDRVLGGDATEGAGRFADRPRYVAIQGVEDTLFQPPAAEQISSHVDAMCTHLNDGGLHPGAAAAWVHIATAAIHPFRDGNGRCARVLASLAMYRGGFRLWAFTTLESWWGHHRDDYYSAFRCLGRRFDPGADVTPFVEAHLRAQLSQVRALDLRDRVEHRVWDALVGLVDAGGLEERVANALWEAFFERDVTAGYYRAVTDVSPATATHDLRAAVAAGLLSTRGERRGRRYLPGPRLFEQVARKIGLESVAERSPIISALAQQETTAARRVAVLQRGRDSALDYEIELSEDGVGVGVVRASLSPEAWLNLAARLGKHEWQVPSGALGGEAAQLARAFIDVVGDVVAAAWPRDLAEITVSSTDVEMLQRIAERARERLGQPAADDVSGR